MREVRSAMSVDRVVVWRVRVERRVRREAMDASEGVRGLGLGEEENFMTLREEE